MYLDLSPEDLAFRDEVRTFLSENLTPELRRAGRRATSVFMDKTYSLAWQKILHVRGWVAPAWPVRHGGTGWNEMQRYIFAAESARRRSKPRSHGPEDGGTGDHGLRDRRAEGALPAPHPLR